MALRKERDGSLRVGRRNFLNLTMPSKNIQVNMRQGCRFFGFHPNRPADVLLVLQSGGEVRTKQKRAHFLCATYLIRLSMQGITFPLTTTFPFRTNPPLVQQLPFDSAHSSSRIIKNIPILMQVRCLTFSCTAAPFIDRNVVMVEGIELGIHRKVWVHRQRFP